MQLPDSVQNILAYGQGYKDGMKDGHTCGFHDALVCAVHDLTGLLKKYHEMEREYSQLQAKAYHERMESVPDLESVTVNHGKWIPCSERLPEVGTPVLIYDKHHKAFFVAKLELDEEYFGFSSNMWHHPADVPFWVPLPEAPKEDDND